jgi:hypothetical protein
MTRVVRLPIHSQPDQPKLTFQGFEGVEVVALNEQVLAVGIAAGQFGHGLQQPVRRACRGPHRLFYSYVDKEARLW